MKKNVAEFFIAEHYRAEALRAKVKDQLSQISELKGRLELKDKVILNTTNDHILTSRLLELEKSTSGSWKKSYEYEVDAHKQTRKKLIKTKIVAGTIVVVTIGLTVLANQN